MDALFNTTSDPMFSQVVGPATKYIVDPAAQLVVAALPAPLGQHIVDSGVLPWFISLTTIWVGIEVVDVVRGAIAANAGRKLRAKNAKTQNSYIDRIFPFVSEFPPMSVDHITLYATQMSSLGYGSALWDPDQGYFENSKRRPHVRPGDVGYVDQNGSFIRLFNLHLGKDDPDQGMAIPDDFVEPLSRQMQHTKWSYEVPRIHHLYKRNAWGGSLKVNTPVVPANADASMSFNFEHKSGAILGFFDVGVREISYVNYGEHLRKNIESWLNTARIMSSDLEDKDLRVVTDCIRVRSWIRGVIEDRKDEGQFSLSVGFSPFSAGAQLSRSVEYQGGSNIHHGPADRIMKLPAMASVDNTGARASSKRKGKGMKRDDEEKAPASTSSQPGSSISSTSPFPLELSETDREDIKRRSDQCIFIRSFRIKHRGIMGKVLPQKIRAEAEPRNLPKDDDFDEGVYPVLVSGLGGRIEEHESAVGIEAKQQSAIKRGSRRISPTPLQKSEEPREPFSDEISSDRDDVSGASWDHMDIVFDYIFEHSNADVALVHESDLMPYAWEFGTPVEELEESLTAAMILKVYPPKVAVRDYDGIKVGTIFPLPDPPQEDSQTPQSSEIFHDEVSPPPSSSTSPAVLAVIQFCHWECSPDFTRSTAVILIQRRFRQNGTVGVREAYDKHDLEPPLAKDLITEARNERRYRLPLVHEFHPSLILPLWTPTPVTLGAVGYLSKPQGEFVTLFNSFHPQKSANAQVASLPPVHEYGTLSIGSQRQDERNVAQKSRDLIGGLFKSSKISRQYSSPLRSGHNAFLCMKTTKYNYVENLDAPKKWFKAHVDTILDVFGPEYHVQKEDLLFVIGTLDTPEYALFISDHRLDGQIYFDVPASPEPGQPWGTFTVDDPISSGLHSSKISTQKSDPWNTVLIARLRFEPDVSEPTSL
ncbi:hypothetical protein D9757_008315 [Collybiopsis confluens]|uniref:Uncharacterized protein n=1 Tax=Collybiopsis confluens TaxID=2823264 RepID=A0A8H5HED5_9AGAR|nr:hypothetical protein D9757_008315 [Collybiopsis confluens]